MNEPSPIRVLLVDDEAALRELSALARDLRPAGGMRRVNWWQRKQAEVILLVHTLLWLLAGVFYLPAALSYQKSPIASCSPTHSGEGRCYDERVESLRAYAFGSIQKNLCRTGANM